MNQFNMNVMHEERLYTHTVSKQFRRISFTDKQMLYEEKKPNDYTQNSIRKGIENTQKKT